MNSRSTSPEVALAAIPPGYLNMMGYVDESEVNGPGRRNTVRLSLYQSKLAVVS